MKTSFDKPKSSRPAPGATAPRPDSSISRFLIGVLPQVSREIRRWDRQLDDCGDWMLLKQAMSSLKHKRFHAQGGCFYALYSPQYSKQMISLVVALQTISDYLDNLCDRGGIYDEAAFRCLHQAMLDALSTKPVHSRDYYRYYIARNDGGYLRALVEECRGSIVVFPAYPVVQGELLRLVSLYNDLQVFKHLHLHTRHARLKRWFRDKCSVSAPPLYFWEFAAACGSTLAMFALLSAAASAHTTEEEVRRITGAYFPWVCGLHILLDYWIDQEEDRIGGDLNFTSCYPSPEIAAQRLHLFLNKSLEGVSRLPHPSFHRTVVRGLLAVYLSDHKVSRQGFRQTAKSLLEAAGSETRLFYRLCLLLRKLKVL
jgi:tetraprenyl-beta-curcumene synthase